MAEPGTQLSAARPASRAAVERRLLEEQAATSQIASWLREGRPLPEWPPEALEALALALHPPPGASPGERWKATALGRHLFRQEAERARELLRPSDTRARGGPEEADEARHLQLVSLADRLRGSLPRLAGLGAGLRCLAPLER